MLKSVFIVVFLVWCFALVFKGISGIVAGENLVPWIGILLTSGPMVVFLMRIMLLKDMARTSANLPVVMLLAFVGVALNVQQTLRAGVDMWFLYNSLGMAGLFLIYNFWYSRLDRTGSMLKAGQKLPLFSLIDTEGNAVTSDTLRGQPTVMIFYRGNWCPLCMAQVKEIANHYNDIKEKGVRTIFVSPQSQNHTRALAKKFSVGIEFYRDEGNTAAEALGIVSQFGTPAGMQLLGYDTDTVLPTVVILDAEGTIVWLHETDNYRVRPEPETFMKVLAEKGLA